jgi:hypothetical protein
MEDTIHWLRYQDVAGQLPCLQGYTLFCLFFSYPNTSAHNRETTTKWATDTSIKLTSLFPWLSGQVINEGSSPENSGIFKIVPYRGVHAGFDILVRNYPELDYSEIMKRRVPMDELDGELLSPKRDLSSLYDLAKSPEPVVVLQLNYLNGGLVLTFTAAHNSMDMNGLGKLIELFGKVSRGESLTKEEMEWGDSERKNVVRLLGPGEVELDHSMYIAESDNKTREPKNEVHHSGNARWAYVRFTKQKLARMKEMAAPQHSLTPLDREGSHTEWISTDDAISSFLWQRITLARSSRLSRTSLSNSTIRRAVNGRRLLEPPISPSYMGHVVSNTCNTIPLSEFPIISLSDIASDLRKELNRMNDYSIRSFVTFISRHENKRPISYASGLELASQDLLLSSGAGLAVYHVDFGYPLGMPECVRRPRWNPAEGVVYLMPKMRNGDLDAAICLTDDDWTRLRGDQVWNEFGEYIG